MEESAPEWLVNPLTGVHVPEPGRPWWKIPDFDPAVGDIKFVWELSRMDWAVAFAQQAAKGEAQSLRRLNEWVADWCAHNPPYKGPNWKCGQEASIRVMHLALAALILGQAQASSVGLRDLVRLHLRRIAPTIQYAMAQDNNHGTSEAAALFVGGSWLMKHGEVAGERWMRSGRKWLENRAERLIGNQGGFSQYSLNYHRVLLDTLCIAEVWRRHEGLPAFSERYEARARSATEWLRHMVSEGTGDGPNVGANDGAQLLQVGHGGYRDFRPTVQLAMRLFARQSAIPGSGPWNDGCAWLGVPDPGVAAPPPGNYVDDEGGFAMLRIARAMALLRYPRFRFRPSQSDVLHLDLWLDGVNVLRDAGTYSYNTSPRWLVYFGGTEGHNTVQFDDRDQMQRISRFLMGDWLETRNFENLHVDGEYACFGAGYRDRMGACHHRQVRLGETRLNVVDAVAGFKRKAVLRWRLLPGQWAMERLPNGVRLKNAAMSPLLLEVTSSAEPVRCEIVEGWESRFYGEMTQVPVLEVEVRDPCRMTTIVRY
jgi:hypothetical protein